MRIRLYIDEDRDRWERYVNGSSTSNHYHHIAWKDVIERSFGHKTYYLLSEDSQKKINGILPLVHLKSILFGNFIISIPYLNYGGICADNDEIGQQLLKEAISIASREGAEHIELRETRTLNNKLSVKTAKVSMLLELPSAFDELWRSFSSKLRSQIKRPQKEGLYIKFGREEEINSFYTVFSVNMRDLGTPVYPEYFFKHILQGFPESTWICTVYTKEKEPVASGFLIGSKDRLEIPWASSLKNYNRYSPNMLLYWSVLKFACENRFKIFDFGRSTPGEGTYRFKEQWGGARPSQLYWHYWMKNGGPLPELNPKNPKYQMDIKIWQRLPVALTRLIGPMIVRNIP